MSGPSPQASEGRDDQAGALEEIEALLVRTFGWSLRDIDETDILSMMGFIRAMGRPAAAFGTGAAHPGRVYADQVKWF